MTKEPKPNFASFTKAELVKTVKKLDARQTKLLNRIAELEVLVAKNGLAAANMAAEMHGRAQATAEDWRHKGEVAAGKPAFPWEKE